MMGARRGGGGGQAPVYEGLGQQDQQAPAAAVLSGPAERTGRNRSACMALHLERAVSRRALFALPLLLLRASPRSCSMYAAL